MRFVILSVSASKMVSWPSDLRMKKRMRTRFRTKNQHASLRKFIIFSALWVWTLHLKSRIKRHQISLLMQEWHVTWCKKKKIHRTSKSGLSAEVAVRPSKTALTSSTWRRYSWCASLRSVRQLASATPPSSGLSKLTKEMAESTACGMAVVRSYFSDSGRRQRALNGYIRSIGLEINRSHQDFQRQKWRVIRKRVMFFVLS